MMLSAVFTNPGRLALEERPRPGLEAPDEVLIAVEACGICGTDLQILMTPPGHPAEPGTILGHELVGQIEAVGPAATAEVGQRVIVDTDPKCGVCEACRAGRPANCRNVVAIGIFRDGALASHVVAPSSALHPIADHVPAHLAALAEPLACVVNAVRRLAPRAGESAVILGGGAIGCLFLASLRANGVSPIVVIEPNQERAAVARTMGADVVAAPDELAATMDRDLPDGADIVVEAVGRLFAEAIEIAALGARIVLFGMDGSARPPIHQVEITERSLTVMGSYVSNFTYPEAIRMLERGTLDLEPMVSAIMPLTQTLEAFELLRSGSATKVVIQP